MEPDASNKDVGFDPLPCPRRRIAAPWHGAAVATASCAEGAGTWISFGKV